MRQTHTTLAMLEHAATTILVTPDAPCALAGFSGRTGQFEAKHSDLEINFARFTFNGAGVVVVACDHLYAGGPLTSFVEEFCRVRGHTAILAASHTHFAPNLDPSKPGLGHVDPEYLQTTLDKVGAALNQLFGRAISPARLSQGRASCAASVNRRLSWPIPSLGSRQQWILPPGIRSAPNPGGPVDPWLHLAVAETGDGEIASVVWTYACHPTSFPHAQTISAEFPGEVRRAIRARVGRDVPVLFLQGFSGDIRMKCARWRTMTDAAKEIVFGPSYRPSTVDEWSGYTQEVVAAAMSAFGSRRNLTNANAIFSEEEQFPLSQLLDGAQEGHKVTSKYIQLAPDLKILSLSAEIVVGYRDKIPPGIWTIGCEGDCFGYWPLDRHVREGGYEAEGFLRPFGYSGTLRASQERAFDAHTFGLTAKSV